MAAWGGLGLNTCHDANDRTEPYMTARFDEIQALGINKVRPNLLVYTTTAGNGVDAIKAYITAATNRGIYCVWGTTVNGASNLTNTTMTGAYRDRVLDLAAFGEALDHPELFELQLGNEDDGRVDGATVTTEQFQAYIRGTLADDVRTTAPNIAKISYTTHTGYQLNWATDGLGSLDRFGLNVYAADVTFRGQIRKLRPAFGANCFISEWNSSDHGYDDFDNDLQHAGEVQERIDFIRQQAISEAYFFGYRVPASTPRDKWSLVLENDGGYRTAWKVLTSSRRFVEGS